MRATAPLTGMSNRASAAGFQVRIVSLVSMTMTAAGNASSARRARSGTALSLRAPASETAVRWLSSRSGRTAVTWRGTEGMRSKIRHLSSTGRNSRERAMSDSERPRKR